MQTLSSRFKVLLIIIAVAVVIGFIIIGGYNSLVSLNESVDTQWAQVESQYQRRFDLIPNLVASVEGSMKQEKEIFTAIANARQGYAGARNSNEKAVAAGQMESALGRLLVITENYPVLKSNENVQSLMSQLEGTENRISVERMRYNNMVKTYNISIKTFPRNIIANFFGFEVKKTFEATEGSERAPSVKIN